MMQNLNQMTNTEIKRYISEHRNDEEAFRAALQVLMSRSDFSTQHPYPFDLDNPESEVEALLLEKLNRTE
ncbi:MAG: hypothetical protein HWQ35_11960 [Nostoc sp. NMS1]|jgi:hypothetical protein|uniref:DUF6887 family protein n=1 Tax=unclassified Nostoc TaxID=2593658 RepID=UPI0025E1EC4C|nr:MULTISPECIES: hypothetical protein [unclassified Nostoc]MBN3907244.1 hypothetical protein [Nostoc sp. NMS1]MBN3989861.1 hypothetical protein [Nostoc sp. NMS2]MDZ8258724.1 hypothetical protein [Nostoc sp. ChiQUE01b]